MGKQIGASRVQTNTAWMANWELPLAQEQDARREGEGRERERGEGERQVRTKLKRDRRQVGSPPGPPFPSPCSTHPMRAHMEARLSSGMPLGPLLAASGLPQLVVIMAM